MAAPIFMNPSKIHNKVPEPAMIFDGLELAR